MSMEVVEPEQRGFKRERVIPRKEGREDIMVWNVRNIKMTQHGLSDISEGQCGEQSACTRGSGKFE